MIRAQLSDDNQILTIRTTTYQEEVTLTVQSKEVRLNVRIEEDLRRRLKAQAAIHGLTMADLIRKLVTDWLTKAERLPYPTQAHRFDNLQDPRETFEAIIEQA